VAISPHF